MACGYCSIFETGPMMPISRAVHPVLYQHVLLRAFVQAMAAIPHHHLVGSDQMLLILCLLDC